MMALEVLHNGRRVCLTGVKDEEVTACVEIVDWRLPNGTPLPSSLKVSAIKDFVNLDWPGVESLAPGDEVLLRVIEVTQVDEPTRVPRQDADAEEAQERLTYEWLKRKYESR